MISPKFLYAPLETKLHTTLRNNCMQEITQLYYLTYSTYFLFRDSTLLSLFLLVSLHDFKEEKISADLYLLLRDVKIFLFRQKIGRILKCIPCFSKNVCVKMNGTNLLRVHTYFLTYIVCFFFLGKSPL